MWAAEERTDLKSLIIAGLRQGLAHNKEALMAVKVKPWKGAWWLFIDHNGQRKAKKVGSKKAAEIAKAQIEARLALGGSLVDDRMVPSCREAAERWLTGHSRLGQISESTEAAYRGHLQQLRVPSVW